MNTSTDLDLAHDTFMLERAFSETPDRVFAAYANCEARSEWAPPTTDEMR